MNAHKSAQDAKIKVGINDEGVHRFDERNNNAINAWTDLLDNHKAQVAQLLASQRKELAEITSCTEGVHFSKKVFFWLAGIWFISISIIIIELTVGLLWLFGLMG